MTRRTLFTALAAFSLILWAGGTAAADDESKVGTHHGTLVKASAGQITMTDPDGKAQHSHAVTADAKVTRDGKECKLTDLRKGDHLTVTAEKKGDKMVITRIEAKPAERR